MNAENFADYLKNPSLLYQISYQELKSLVMQYPYAPNLRYLLVQKAKMDNHLDYNQQLADAAAYSLDRSVLFNLIKSIESRPILEENYELNEDYLELKDLAAIEFEAANTEEAPTEKLTFSLEETPADNDDYQVEASSDSEIDEDEDSLLERLIAGEFADLDNPTEHEALNNVPLAEMTKASADKIENPEEEAAISEVLSALENKEIVDQDDDDGDDFEEVVLEKSINKSLTNPIDVSDDIEILAAVANIGDDLFEEEEDEETELIIDISSNIIDEAKPDPPSLSKRETKEDENEKPLVKKSVKPHPRPVPKSSFSSWLDQYDSVSWKSKVQQKEVVSTKKKKKKKAKYDAPVIIAKASIQEDEEIATETLALLLEKQQHYDKAIKMYETLGLRNPEKSSFFASKIENIKKIMNELE